MISAMMKMGQVFFMMLVHHIPRLNSTIPSFPPRSWNSGSSVLALTAWRWGNAASASGSAKMEVVKISPDCALADRLVFF
jgi:hypothetical protein